MARVRLVAAVLLSISAGVAAQPSSAPLPDQATFFAEARKRLASNDLIQSRYSFRERTTELRLNPFGRSMGTGPVNVYEVYPHPEEELTYRRLIERDGAPLSAKELAEQDREYREKLEAWQRRLAREGTSDRAERLQRAAEAKARDEAMAREALEMFDFEIVGRDTWHGEPAIVVTFTPRPNASPRSREGRVARAFTGKAWIHEFDYELMNVEAHAIDDVAFGWGMIAKLYRGSTARFTRQKIDGVWLPVASRFEGSGKALLVRRVVIKFARDYYDYRPFDQADLPARLGWAP
jgi:hypothetical protein